MERSISQFVRLINDVDRGLSYVVIFFMLIGGAALVGLIAYVTGFTNWLWVTATLDPNTSDIDRIGVGSLFVGMPAMLLVWFIVAIFYQKAGESRYETALAEAGNGATGGLGYGLGYWSYTVNGVTAHSRFAPR